MSETPVRVWSRGLGASCGFSLFVGVVLTVVLLSLYASGQSDESHMLGLFMVFLLPYVLVPAITASVLGALAAGLAARWSTSWLVPALVFTGVVVGAAVASLAFTPLFYRDNELVRALAVVGLVALGGGAIIGRFLLRLGRKPVMPAESPPAMPGPAA